MDLNEVIKHLNKLKLYNHSPHTQDMIYALDYAIQCIKFCVWRTKQDNYSLNADTKKAGGQIKWTKIIMQRMLRLHQLYQKANLMFAILAKKQVG